MPAKTWRFAINAANRRAQHRLGVVRPYQGRLSRNIGAHILFLVRGGGILA